MLKISIVSPVQREAFGEQRHGFSINKKKQNKKRKKNTFHSGTLKIKYAAHPNVKSGGAFQRQISGSPFARGTGFLILSLMRRLSSLP